MKFVSAKNNWNIATLFDDIDNLVYGDLITDENIVYLAILALIQLKYSMFPSKLFSRFFLIEIIYEFNFFKYSS